MPEIFFCSDHHLGHFNVLKHDKRPFASIEEHDRELIRLHNELVSPRDLVYVLGDIAWNMDPRRYLDLVGSLNGRKVIVFGNHDQLARKYRQVFVDCYEGYQEFRIGGEKMTLSHMPMLSWNASFHGRRHLFGHVHSSPTKWVDHQPNSIDVGLPSNGYKPKHLDQVLRELDESASLPRMRNFEYDSRIVSWRESRSYNCGTIADVERDHQDVPLRDRPGDSDEVHGQDRVEG